MADETPGAPSGGATSAAPAASTPAPAAAPVSTPAAVPAATPAAVPAVPAIAAPAAEASPTKTPGEADDKFIKRVNEWRDKNPTPTGDEKPVDAPKPAAVVEPAKPAEEVKVDPKPAVAADAEKPVAAALDDAIEALGPLPASKMAELLTANPALNAALEEAGIKDELFDSLREAAVATQFREEFADVDTAKFAKQAAITLHKMDEAATNLKRGDMESTKKFVQDVLMPMSYKLDDEGKPIMREIKRDDGSILRVPETDGTVQTFFDNIREVIIEQIVADASVLVKRDNPQQQGLGEELQAAMEVVRNYIKGSDSTAAANLPEELKAEAERIRVDRESLNTRKTEEAQQRYTDFANSVQQAVDADLDANVIRSWIKGSSLEHDPSDSQQTKEGKEFAIKAVTAEIRTALYESLNKNDLFLSEQSQIGRRGYSPATRAALVNAYNRTAQGIIERIATPILTKAGYERIRQSAARARKVAAQEKVSKMEPRGSSSPALPRPQEIDQSKIVAEARAEFIKEHRRDPRPDELLEIARNKVALATRTA